jgi:site-specific DNA recombinase
MATEVETHRSSRLHATKRAVVYARVSTDGQEENGTSLLTQHTACINKASQLGLDVVGSFEDTYSGASLQKRHGLQNALAALDAGLAKTFICYDFSRYSRDEEHQQTIARRVERAGAKLVFCTIDVDVNTADGSLTFALMGAVAAAERRKIRERTMMGKRRRAEQGKAPVRSRNPFGYKIVTKNDVIRGEFAEEQVGTYVLVAEQVEIVREIFRLYLSGQSLRKVCGWLNKQGIRTNANNPVWVPQTLKRLIQNSIYRGQAVAYRKKALRDEGRLQRGFKNETYTINRDEQDWLYIPAPAIVSDELWYACNRKLVDNRSAASGCGDKKSLLSSLIRCPRCNRRMVAHTQRKLSRTGNGTVFVYKNYFCPLHRPSASTSGIVCNNTRYHARIYEPLVISAVRDMAHSPAKLEAAMAAAESMNSNREATTNLESLRMELKSVEKQIDQTLAAQIAGIEAGVPARVYERKLCQLAERENELNERIEEIAVVVGNLKTEDEIKDTAKAISNAVQAVEDALSCAYLSDAEKRGLLATVVEAVYPTEAEDGEPAVTIRWRTQ